MLGIDLTQILLHLFNTAILFAGLYFLLYKPVQKFMQKREEQYKAMDEAAAQKLAEAEKEEALYQEKLQTLEAEIEEKRQQQTAEMDQERENRMAEALAEAEKILDKARANAAEERSQILESVRGDITLMVEEAARKIVAEKSPSESFDAFLSEAGEKAPAPAEASKQ